jgi:hypothetical protein
MNWRSNPQRVAWFVLCSSLAVFCLLAIAIPLAVRDYLLHSTRPIPSAVTTMAGTVQLWAPQADIANAVTGTQAVLEGSILATDSAARALFAVGAAASDQQPTLSMQLFESTVIMVERLRTPRFAISSDPDETVVRLDRGRLTVNVGPPASQPARVQLITPAASISLGDGSYYVTISGDETEVSARVGTAQVMAAGTAVSAAAGQRVTVRVGAVPDAPVPAAVNLVHNGAFTGQLEPEWVETLEVAAGLQPGQLTVEPNGATNVIHFFRRVEDGQPSAVKLQQAINRDVQAFSSLVLRFDLRLIYQSVPGGGVQSSEYPVMVDIGYTDIYGKELHWHQGFYYQDLPAGSNWRQPDGEKVLLGTWYTYESRNLLDELKDTRPARINTLTLYATGHDYESQVADPALIVR